ncbi:hypothetical protein SAMN05444336_101252 [Albimonas donghaensis]|uniref:Uncharacterized protein n=1 Tax=Albimonas donghaensis TaxID=356660 RepID=A0A1H2R741_9RHOB|nr:hypothetical protein [Albimonas donghaensis]SDW15038.1 hypothetical protein SAMN05444336_101252 [Albimonas donghaensis]
MRRAAMVTRRAALVAARSWPDHLAAVQALFAGDVVGGVWSWSEAGHRWTDLAGATPAGDTDPVGRLTPLAGAAILSADAVDNRPTGIATGLKFDGINDAMISTATVTPNSKVATVMFSGRLPESGPRIVAAMGADSAVDPYRISLVRQDDRLHARITGSSGNYRVSFPMDEARHTTVVTFDGTTAAGEIAAYVDGVEATLTIENSTREGTLFLKPDSIHLATYGSNNCYDLTLNALAFAFALKADADQREILRLWGAAQ